MGDLPELMSSDEEDEHLAAKPPAQALPQPIAAVALNALLVAAAPPVAAPAAGAQAGPGPNMAEADEAMAAALAAEGAEEDEVAEIRLGKRFHIAFPALLIGHVAMHWLDRVKTEVQHASIKDAINTILAQKGVRGWTEGWMPSFTESILKVFVRMYTHTLVTNWLKDRYRNGDRTKKLTGFPLMVSSAVLATTESILLTTPLQLLKLRHMNTRSYVPFRTMLYECLFARPPTVLYHGFWLTWARQMFNHMTWWFLWEAAYSIPGLTKLQKTSQQLIVTAVTGFVMTALCNPIEVLKTNFQSSFNSPPVGVLVHQITIQRRWWSGLLLRLCASPVSQLVAWLLLECTQSIRPQNARLPVVQAAAPQQDPH